jgi:membrane fusion protein (multidrug efflux system)
VLQRLEKIEAALELANADLRQREKQLAAAEAALQTAQALRNRDLIATRDVHAAEATTETARAEKKLAQARVAQQQAVLEQARFVQFSNVVAPTSGVVMRRLAESGAYVDSSMSLLTIAPTDSSKVMIDVAEKEAGLLHEGMTAQIRVDERTGQVFEGRITALHNRSAATRGALAEIRLINPGRSLRPGMSVEVTLIQNGDALLVPQQAVFSYEGASYVYIVANEKMAARAVTTGPRQDGAIEIKSGVGEGSWIVVSGRDLVKPNSRVHPVVDQGSRSGR